MHCTTAATVAPSYNASGQQKHGYPPPHSAVARKPSALWVAPLDHPPLPSAPRRSLPPVGLAQHSSSPPAAPGYRHCRAIVPTALTGDDLPTDACTRVVHARHPRPAAVAHLLTRRAHWHYPAAALAFPVRDTCAPARPCSGPRAHDNLPPVHIVHGLPQNFPRCPPARSSSCSTACHACHRTPCPTPSALGVVVLVAAQHTRQERPRHCPLSPPPTGGSAAAWKAVSNGLVDVEHSVSEHSRGRRRGGGR